MELEFGRDEYGTIYHRNILCPHGCGYRFNAMQDISTEPGNPTEGDVSICFKCLGLLELKSGTWIIASKEKILELSTNQPEDWKRLNDSRAEVLRFRHRKG